MALLLFGSGPGSSGVKVNLLGVQPVEAIRLLVVFALAAYFGRRIELLRALSQPATADRAVAALLPRAAVEGCSAGARQHGPGARVLLPSEGPRPGARADLRLPRAVRARPRPCGVRRHRLRAAARRIRGSPTGSASRPPFGSASPIWSDPMEQRRARRQSDRAWALGARDRRAWGSGAGLGNPQMFPAGTPTSCSPRLAKSSASSASRPSCRSMRCCAWRCLRVALRAPGDYSAFLAVGVALGLVVQALVIAGGLLGLVPLSGVVTPFLSFGRSSMLANCFAVGVVLAIAQRRGPERAHLRAPIRAVSGVLARCRHRGARPRRLDPGGPRRRCGGGGECVGAG